MAVIDVTERPVFHLGPDTARIVYPSGVASGVTVGTAQANTFVLPTGVAAAGVVGTAAVTAQVDPTGINAGTGSAGSAAFVASVHPDGIAGTDTVGTAQVNAAMQPSGLASTAVMGAVTAFTSMNPTGVNAATGAVGTAKSRASLHPTGIASTVNFGDTDTVATVFIIPGPVDPTNDFGDAVVTKRGWIFRNPTIQLGWRFQKRYEGVSLLKENGVWVEVSHPDLERTLSAQKYLPGGHDHVVSDSLKAELIAAGYTVTDEVVTTEDYKS